MQRTPPLTADEKVILDTFFAGFDAGHEASQVGGGLIAAVFWWVLGAAWGGFTMWLLS